MKHTAFSDIKVKLFLFVVIATLFSCSGNYEKYSVTSDHKPLIFPDYTDVTVPVNIAPLNFKLSGAERIRVQVSYANETLFDIKSDSLVKFPKKKWSECLKNNVGKDLSVTVTAWTKDNPDGIRYKSFTISVSNDEIDSWIAYRLIPPGYELWKRMGIYQRDVSSFNEEPIIKNTQNNGGCVNCHNFCKYDPNTWVFHGRGKGGGTIVTHKGVSRKVAIEKMGPKKGATYPAWHPSGKYIAFSSNITRQVFYGICIDKIEVFDTESNLIVYDVLNDSVMADPRFNEGDDWETFPGFSPDGKYLYYCVAHQPQEGERSQKPTFFESLQYSLCRVPFDEQTGRLGAKVDTLYNVNQRGGSVSFPRISPDGRFLLYTWAESATFPIQHVEAELKMIDLNTGKDVDTKILNSEFCESYHSWSSNGKWIVFSSKRMDGRYTRLFFSHFNEQGKFTKPFMLPQENPDHNFDRMNAYNIPEFIKAKVVTDKDDMSELFQNM